MSDGILSRQEFEAKVNDGVHDVYDDEALLAHDAALRTRIAELEGEVERLRLFYRANVHQRAVLAARSIHERAEKALNQAANRGEEPS